MDDRNDKLISSLTGQSRRNVDRRRRKDWVVRSVTVIAVLGWICAITALFLMDRASPPKRYELVAAIHGGTAVGYWNTALLRWAFVATLASFVVCVIGFVANVTRHRRKTDRFNKLLITIGIISTCIFAYYLINFARYL